MIDVRPKIIVVGAFSYDTDKQHPGGVITATRTLMESQFSTKADVLRIDTSAVMGEGLLKKLSKSIGRFMLLIKYIYSERPVAIFAWAAGGFSLYEKLLMMLVGRIARVRPVIMFVDSLWMGKILSRPYSKKLHKVLFAIPSTIVCRSSSWVDMYRELGVSDARCDIVYNWIDLKRYPPVPLSVVRRKLLFVGWLIKEKGVYELLDAFVNASSVISDLELVLVGDGPEREGLMSRANKAEVLGRVTFTGWLGAAEVTNVYQSSHVLILPSYGEGFPYVIVEAMASCLPVITTPVGGIPGILNDNETVFFADPRNIESLTQKILFVCNNKQAVSSVIMRSYDLVNSNNDVNVTSEKLFNILTV